MVSKKPGITVELTPVDIPDERFWRTLETILGLAEDDIWRDYQKIKNGLKQDRSSDNLDSNPTDIVKK